MNSVQFRNRPKLSISRMLAAFFLSMVFVACGTNPVAPSSSTQPHPGSTASKPTSTSNAPLSASDSVLKLNAAMVTINSGNLRIQSKYGFQCPSSLDGVRENQLVLASDRTTYSQSEVAQMRASVTQYSGGAHFLVGAATLPPTLRWVLGGSMDLFSEVGGTCGATLQLTNTGNTPIQIPDVGVQLEANPQVNTFSYRLIDVCTLITCGPGPGGGPGCNFYGAGIQLGAGEKNTTFSAVPSATSADTRADCGTLTIAPAAEVDLNIYFSLALNTPKNLIYSILPILTVDTAQGEQTLALPQLVSTLAFASASQFSCYGLQGMAFVQELPPGVSSACI
jgi:hypothetical protein